MAQAPLLFASMMETSTYLNLSTKDSMVRADIFQGQTAAFLEMLRQAAPDADAAMRTA